MSEREATARPTPMSKPDLEALANRETLSRVIDDMFEALGVHNNEDALIEIDRLRTASTASGEPVAWRDGEQNPSVKPGNQREFLVAIYRAKSDKTYTTTGYYLNAYPLDYRWDDEHENPTTGWFYLTGDGDNDSGCYHDFNLRDGDCLKAWAEIPAWPSAHRSPAAEASTWDEAEQALQAVHDFMKVDRDSGDSDLWTPEYEDLFETVTNALRALRTAQGERS